MLYEFQFFSQDQPDVWIETIKDKKKIIPTYTKNWIRVKYIAGLDRLQEVQSKIKGKIKKRNIA